MSGPGRHLHFDGCSNARDLGGLPLPGGGTTARGVVVRAATIRHLSEAGWRTLRDYGVLRTIDLRAAYERPVEPPPGLGVEVVRLPMTPEDSPEVMAWPTMHDAYLAMLAAFGEQFAAAATAVATAPGTVLVHCHAGRDRTGLLCALLLRLAGVPAAEIAGDHALSDSYWLERGDWLDRAATPQERAWRERTTLPAGDTMVGVLAEVDERWGGAEGYLVAAGASPENLHTIVLRLRG